MAVRALRRVDAKARIDDKPVVVGSRCRMRLGIDVSLNPFRVVLTLTRTHTLTLTLTPTLTPTLTLTLNLYYFVRTRE